MKTDARNIYLRDWRKKRKTELTTLRAELELTRAALLAAAELIAYIDNPRKIEHFGDLADLRNEIDEKYQVYRKALKALKDGNG